MELLRISDSKLKVTLSADDMEKYRLDNETMDYDNTETRSAFWQILDEAKHKTGFDAGGEKIFVQVYPSRCGGCEMYVTKVSEERALSAAQRRTPPVSLVRGSVSVYRFETLDLLITVCRKLKEIGYTGESAAYGAEDDFWLVIRERLHNSIMSANAISEYSFIEEYGTRQSGGIMLAYLREHGTTLETDAAVDRFALL